MEFNFLAIVISSLIPILLGFVWYNPKTLGNAWMKAAEITEEKMKGTNMGLIFGLSLLFSFMLAFSLQSVVIHQFGLFSLLQNQPGMMDKPVSNPDYINMMAKYGTNFRTYKHGALHGVLMGLFIILPILGINALFEKKGFKYIAINVGFWTVCLGIMGAIICGWM